MPARAPINGRLAHRFDLGVRTAAKALDVSPVLVCRLRECSQTLVNTERQSRPEQDFFRRTDAVQEHASF